MRINFVVFPWPINLLKTISQIKVYTEFKANWPICSNTRANNRYIVWENAQNVIWEP